LNRHDGAHEVRSSGGDPEGEESAEAVADQDGVIESVIADVAYDAVADVLKPQAWHRRLGGEPGKSEHVHAVAVAVVAHSAIPYGPEDSRPGIRIIGFPVPITVTENSWFWQTAQDAAASSMSLVPSACLMHPK
jgi:hypothetical protein